MKAPGVPTVSPWERLLNLVIPLSYTASTMFFSTPGKFGHRIAGLGFVFIAVVLFRSPVKLTAPLWQKNNATRLPNLLDRVLLYLALAFISVGLALRYFYEFWQ